MILTCSQSSRHRFTPGRSYVAHPGGKREAEYYVDLRDDAGHLQRFAAAPCPRVGNEHPLAELAEAFPMPADAPVSRELSVWRTIRDSRLERPLILVQRSQAKQWVLAFQNTSRAETRVITSAAALNSLIVNGIARGIYISTVRSLFLGTDGRPLPTTAELFDGLFDIDSDTQ